MKNSPNLKIAIIHDWLLNIGGAERVLKNIHAIFPDAVIFTLFYDEYFVKSYIPNARIKSTFLQKAHKFLKNHKILTPLIPIAIESIDLSEFDLVISSSVSFSKGVITKPETKHICYCFSPTRFLWDWHTEYKKKDSNSKISEWSIKLTQHLLRIWDRQASARPDYFVAISKNVQNRVKKYYKRDSIVIYPPVSRLDNYENQKLGDSFKIKGFYLIVSRLYSHKNIDVAVEAFNKLKYPLVIIGKGPEGGKLKKIAGENITFMGELSDSDTAEYYSQCSAFIMPQEEDFGITPLEAMLYGKPVLALKRGGALEYVLEGINGEFFDDPTVEVLADGVRRLNENIKNYSPFLIKKTAERFSRERFKKELTSFISKITGNLSNNPSGTI